MNCLVCNKPTEYPTMPDRPLHFECEECSICHEKIFEPQLGKCLDEFRKDIETNPDRALAAALIMVHPRCREERMANEMKKRPIDVSQEMLDFYNEQNLLFQPNLELSPTVNQQVAANLGDAFFKKWIKDETLEEQYVRLKRMEAITIAFSLLIDKKKARAAVDEHEVKRIRRQAKEEKDKQEVKLQEKRERLDPAARAQRKALEAIMSLGMSEEQALEFMKGQQKGKVQ